MRSGNTKRWAARLALAMSAALFLPAGASSQAAAPAAGKIGKLIPVDQVVRERKPLEAKSGMQVLWGDLVRTGRGGRVRVELEDGSILNVGSESSLLIQKHDPQAQQTELEVEYGRVRADAVKIVRPGGTFNLRTKTAVAGVVGTQEYLEASDIVTTVIALGGGQVAVSSTDARFPEPILLNPGEAVTLVAARRPGPKRPATAQELIRAVQETEVDSVATLSPGQTVAGRSFDATISGKGLSNAKALSFGQPGIQVQTRGQITATRIPVHIAVAADVPLGTYTLTIERPEGPARSSLVVTTQQAIQASQAALSALQPPSGLSLSGIRGAKFSLDASSTKTAPGTQVVSYQWTVVNTSLRSHDSAFAVNTSLLAPGNYTVQLVVVNDRGQTATQQYPLLVLAGIQPAEIIRNLATAYDSLQPSLFLSNFDDQKFRNYAGFAAAIEDSFRNQLESVRVFQRPVNCSVIEEQDQAICQADFELQFTKKDQPTVLLDAQGNPVPPGAPPPPGAMLGKQVLKGTEHTTLRFERGDAGWKIVDYASVVSCPGGATTTGVNVGSCVLALGSSTTPSFQILNVQVLSTDLPLGGSVTGTFQVSPMGGFTGFVNFTGQGQIGDQSVTVQFSPNPSNSTATVNFTVVAPAKFPTGFSGAQPFVLVITGKDTTTATVTATANVNLVLQPNFSLSVSPMTSNTSPVAVTQNIPLPFGVTVVPGAGFTGTVLVDFPNLPAGFQVSPSSGNVAAGATAPFSLQAGSTAAPGPAFITVRGTSGVGLVKTAALFVLVQLPQAKPLPGAATSATKVASQPAGSSSGSGTQAVFLTTSPPTTESAPAQVQPNSTTNTFVNVLVNSDGSISGPVNLSLAGVANGITASLTPSALEVTGGALQMVQLRLRASSGSIPAGTQSIQVVATSGSFTATTTVFVATPAGSTAGGGVSGPRVVQVRAPAGQPGSYTPVTILGAGLSGIREVVTDTPELSARIEPGGTSGQIQLSVFIKPRATPGTHTLMLAGPQGSVPVAFTVNSGERPGERLQDDQAPRRARDVSAQRSATTSDVPASPGDDRSSSRPVRRPSEGPPALRIEELTMAPLHPRLGETVTFRVRIRNEGAQPVEDAAMEFSIVGTTIRQREQISLRPAESQQYEFEWQASGSGRLVPRVVVDPEHRIGGLDRANTLRSLEPFEVASEPAAAAVRTPESGTHAPVLTERSQMRLVPGGCVGFRFASGTEQACGSGADFELRASEDATVTIQAEGVRSLGARPLDQVGASAEPALSQTAAAQPGSTYVVETPRGAAALRITQIRRIGAASSVPPALRRPQARGVERDEGLAGTGLQLLLRLEWRLLPPR